MDRQAAFAAQNFFSFVPSEYYEPLSKYSPSDIFKDKLEALLPIHWKLFRSDVWLHAQYHHPKKPSIPKRVQGFKIHLSIAPKLAHSLLETVVPILVEKAVNFKIACDDKILHLLNSKLQPRGYAGKFMTIYPPDLAFFKDLLEELYIKTQGHQFEGPYILSDKRYKDSKILYYRYGGFYPPSKLNIDGSQSSFLISPKGEHVPDARLPYFSLPKWAKDPFSNTAASSEQTETLLKDRYQIEGAFGFSNAGGVYYGTDIVTQRPIIIKEARPNTNCWKVNEHYWDAVYLLEREDKILRHIQDLEFIPQPLDFFQEWEHTFLVEAKVEGIRLDSFWALDDMILAPYIRRTGVIDHFIPKFKRVARALINMVRAIHQKGVLLGDLSSRNILINRETYDLWMIDFESAVFQNDHKDIMAYATKWGTEGFINPDRKNRQNLLPIDDYYSVGMILYGAVVPSNNMFSLHPNAKHIFLNEFVRLGIPDQVKGIITSLLEGDYSTALTILNNWSTSDSQTTSGSYSFTLKHKTAISQAIDGITKFIVQSADTQRRDRLWPAHYSVFITNPLNISYGASGILLFLLNTRSTIPKTILNWLANQSIDTNNYPPGLYLGIAGVAYTYLQTGHFKKAGSLMDLVFKSPLLYNEPGVFLGVAGWGQVSLHFYYKTGKTRYLNRAIEAGEHLLKVAEERNEYYCWPVGSDKKVHYGYGYGASGISLFLLQLHKATKQNVYLEFARKGLEFDLSEKVESEVGLQWKRFEGDTLLYPYLIHGSAGIGSVVLRFAQILDSKYYRKIARKIVEDSYIKYSFIPSQFEGLAGIGELMIDAYLILKDEKYLNFAADIAESVLWFGIDKPEGIAFPGRWLTKISNDYATGSSGIGLFLTRLLNPGPRHFMDPEL